MIREIKREAASGLVWPFGLLFASAVVVWWFVQMARTENVLGAIAAGVTALVVFILWLGLFIVNPNEAKVLQLFGRYAGTVHEQGLKWANPFYTKKKISVRVQNFETGTEKFWRVLPDSGRLGPSQQCFTGNCQNPGRPRRKRPTGRCL